MKRTTLLALFSFCFFVAGQSFDKSLEQGDSANCECIDSLFQIAKAQQFAGNTEEAVRYFALIIDRCFVVDSCNFTFVSASYKYLVQQYTNNRQFDLLVHVAKKYLDKLDLAKESFENEQINTLYHLSVFDRQNMDEAFSYGVRAEKILLNA